ncbi:hypothetical protein CEUSTIGMA_g11640.t1 [Chlamydomonas eustigma]|uniref:RRM domain-containing protein n=1 Tax=Chlamydomonas eustigma TaxID=1157962 RepID=A0A250XMB6_9CHLO|nr:hypothetical protein CEUSTIGMA_g11640.t1 [Chlamydomonas eustigma]|eukprot:GAX84217.1 hypothetical protein CEUSTIGMA_g11640.t1 [Chlamydomonas eustigma]
MPRKSSYVLYVDNVSSSTPARDIDKEFSYCGKVRDVIKDNKLRCALVEFYSSKDAEYAWRKMDGLTMDGRRWKVDWAEKGDFKIFGWKWSEGDDTPPRGRSRSRSASRSPSEDRSRSRSPNTPHQEKHDEKRADGSKSP